MSLNENFESAVRPQGRRAEWSAERFVEAWNDFVEQVVGGYCGDLYEYENELSVRDDLQFALNDDELRRLVDWNPLAARVAASDLKLRDLLARGPVVRPGMPWWRERLPPSAGDDLAADAFRLFGAKVDVE